MMCTRRAVRYTSSLGTGRCLCIASTAERFWNLRISTIASNNSSTDRNLPTTFRCMTTTTTTSSVSSAEVHKFNEMHRDWWDPAKNVLIPMNMVRVQYIQTICQRHFANNSSNSNNNKLQQQQQQHNQLPLQGLRALDIGCGGGLLSESLARLGAVVTGLDPSPQLLAAAQQHAALDRLTRNNIQYRNGTAEELAAEHEKQQQKKQPYDIVCLLEVMEHATNVPSLLQAASSLLHPDHGILFVSTVNRTLKSYALTIIGAEYLLRYIPVGTHDWKQYRSPQEFALQAKECANLEEMDVHGMVLKRLPFLNILNQTWDWKLDPNDTDVNWIGAYRKSTRKTKTEA